MTMKANTEYFLCAQRCSEYLKQLNSFNPHNNAMQSVALLVPTCRTDNWDIKKTPNLPGKCFSLFYSLNNAWYTVRA